MERLLAAPGTLPPYWTRTPRRKVKIGDRFLKPRAISGSRGQSLRAPVTATISWRFAEDFVCGGSLLDVGGAPRVAILPVELRKTVFLDGVGGAVGVVEADADGVGAARSG